MPKASLVGKSYGEIQVIKYLGNKRYKCKCVKCGVFSERYSSNLKGNLKCRNCSKGFKVDLTGQKFGHLTVVEYNKDTKKWKCQCDCGSFIEVKSNNLKHHNTFTCGVCGYKELTERQVVGNTRISQTVFKRNKSPNARNTSGHTGVWYNKRKNKWCAAITFCKKKLLFRLLSRHK